MIHRCKNQKSRLWRWYGGRGIKVCKRWLASFDNFYADMGPRPSKYYSLDRVNNDGNYTPKNCRWATKTQQQGNMRFYRVKGRMPKREALIIWRNPKLSVSEAIELMTKWKQATAYKQLGKRDVPAGRRPK